MNPQQEIEVTVGPYVNLYVKLFCNTRFDSSVSVRIVALKSVSFIVVVLMFSRYKVSGNELVHRTDFYLFGDEYARLLKLCAIEA